MRGTGTGTDLEWKTGGAEERISNGVEYGFNLLLLDGEQMLPRRRSGGGVFVQKVLEENNGWYSTLHSVPGGDSTSTALSRDGLDCVVLTAPET